jgi:TetR/AcrR family transcriptional regulator
MPPTTPPATTNRQRRKEARPQELLDAALDLFVEKGFAATRSEEVAVRAGVSKGTLYLYYPSKEELLKEVIRHNMVNQIAEGTQIVRDFEGSTSELLALVFTLWWERIGETRASGIMKLMISEVRNFPEIAQFYADEVVLPAASMVSQLIQRGIDRAEFRVVDVPEVVHALMAPMLYLVMHKHSIGACGVGHTIEPKTFIATHIDLVLHGLEAPRAATPAIASTPPARVKPATKPAARASSRQAPAARRPAATKPTGKPRT